MIHMYLCKFIHHTRESNWAVRDKNNSTIVIDVKKSAIIFSFKVMSWKYLIGIFWASNYL